MKKNPINEVENLSLSAKQIKAKLMTIVNTKILRFFFLKN